MMSDKIPHIKVKQRITKMTNKYNDLIERMATEHFEFIEKSVGPTDATDAMQIALDAALAAIRADPAAFGVEVKLEDWQSIVTAPTGGPRVWVFGEYYEFPVLREADGDFWRYEKKHGKMTFQYWMPQMTPSKPTTKPASEE